MSVITLKHLGLQDYLHTYQAMQAFSAQRQPDTADEVWLVEHPPVFTQGLNGQAEHIQQSLRDIPLVHTDRGGQITYHGPGQLVVYVLIDLRRRKLGVRQLISLLEQSVINLLADYQLSAQARVDAPGIYLEGKKIASLGLKIKRQTSYHGLALNINMDLTPFEWITPCGLQAMQMTQLADYLPDATVANIKPDLVRSFRQQLENSPIMFN
ncbi:lipoyl(octanoyl) transferase LipB [Thiomicrospira sp. R3]|uniref:lipoyl(octanoyl) transferase LipB n=1 Tax=Thiomicrospira sp. R3 TaxID=3035472 RepID=UPI00259BDCA4|nr:lipoyl(octanoyl) transferase LipB [Thiomicrospira sp. R3]WFE69078.1 lipoyl(octanoyl) transferase LipB [Thiomicrospira sp. R3]